MAQGFAEAVMRRAPRATGDTAPPGGANFQTAIAATSTTDQVTLPNNAPANGACWVTFKASSNCRIRFGRAGIGAAVQTDAPIYAGQTEEFYCNFPEDAAFSVIRDSGVGTGFTPADGLLDRWRSSR